MVRFKWNLVLNVPRVILGSILAILMATVPDLPKDVEPIVLAILIGFTFLIIALSIEKDNGSKH